MILDNQIHVERLEQSTEYRVTHGATNARVTSHFDILKESRIVSDDFAKSAIDPTNQ